MLRERLWYLLYFSSLVAVGPFINLFFEERGFTNYQIGFLATIQPWISAPAGFFFCAAADSWNSHKLVLLLTFGLSTVLRSFIYFAHTYRGFVVLVLLTEAVASPCCVIVDSSTVAKCGKDYGKVRLWGAVGWGVFSFVSGSLVSRYGMAVGFLLQWVLAVPCFAISAVMQLQQKSTTQVIVHPKQATDKAPAGCDPPASIEAMDCSGVELTALESVQLLGSCPAPDTIKGHSDQHPAVTESPPSPPSPLPSPPTHTSIAQDTTTAHSAQHDSRQHKPFQDPAASAQPPKPPSCYVSKQSAGLERPLCNQISISPPPSHPPPFLTTLLHLLSTPGTATFLLMALWMGVGMGVISTYLFLHIRQLGGSELLMGLMLTVTCVAEIPSFHYQSYFLERIGLEAMLHCVLAAFVLRLTAYAVLPFMGCVWWVLPVELLHGLTFAWAWGCGTMKCQRLATGGLETTVQSVFSGIYFGLGPGLGALSGGVLSTAYGHQVLFAVAAIVVAGGWALCAVMSWLGNSQHRWMGWGKQVGMGGRTQYRHVPSTEV